VCFDDYQKSFDIDDGIGNMLKNLLLKIFFNIEKRNKLSKE
jgi:hypothetical protein